MSIQRQYSLPSCKLILEGKSSEGQDSFSQNLDKQGLDQEVRSFDRPLISEVDTIECYFSGYEKPLRGGRVFLESLASTVSTYVQGFLSGIPHGAYVDRQHSHKLVELERIDQNLHRLMVQPQVADGAALTTAPQQFDLTTVQLFDLVEAIDRFHADEQTLPDFKLNLAPVPKRYVMAQEPIAKRAAAPALGTAGLAIAALALFFIPAPPVQRPEPASATSSQTAVSPSVSPSAASPPNPPPSPAASPGAGTAEEASALLLTTAPEITDPAEQERLKTVLYEKIDPAWKITPTFQTPLEYQAGVAANGDLVGYQFLNDEALQYKQEVPLLDLLRIPAAAPNVTGAESQEAIARFRVVFKPDGVLEVSPWYGQPPTEPSPSPSP
ncbi:MAG: DUF4335 domain-containing protein [Drouetiella hepatica Uher 2000/2452]|jgi:hypothetical protein|uniref:DUF4335 domain-containing protein n=1 Tax=Drouetiella hepatica Uher 2000/2452 TaxID=904376 RepID=A0A951QEK3_9CYAN|nr:DUF4335 domain-containing protein [Drouetiella hepatica Uher 2000/2452]